MASHPREIAAVINKARSGVEADGGGGDGGAREVSGVMRWQPLPEGRWRRGAARLNPEPTCSLWAQEVSVIKLMRQAGWVAGSGRRK